MALAIGDDCICRLKAFNIENEKEWEKMVVNVHSRVKQIVMYKDTFYSRPGYTIRNEELIDNILKMYRDHVLHGGECECKLREFNIKSEEDLEEISIRVRNREKEIVLHINNRYGEYTIYNEELLENIIKMCRDYLLYVNNINK